MRQANIHGIFEHFTIHRQKQDETKEIGVEYQIRGDPQHQNAQIQPPEFDSELVVDVGQYLAKDQRHVEKKEYGYVEPKIVHFILILNIIC